MGIISKPESGNRQPIALEGPIDESCPSLKGARLVDDLHAAFGNHHVRAVHAKGVILEGQFRPAWSACALSRAFVFAGEELPVTVRFSDFTGIPDIPDTIDSANPRGLAVKFHNSDGSVLDIVAHSYNGFPTSTAEEFGALLRAIGASVPGGNVPTPLDEFLESHPIAKTFLSTQKPPPVSYATAAYYGVNSFAFIDMQGRKLFVRYRFIPLAGELYLNEAARRANGPDYLRNEISQRVADTPVEFDWLAQVSDDGDAIEDPSVAWPDNRRLVKLGTIRINRLALSEAAKDKSLSFRPGSLPIGIEAADPMLAIRDAAYPISFRQRQGSSDSGVSVQDIGVNH